MELPYCELFDFNEEAIQKRLNLLELRNEDLKLAETLHKEIILPNAKDIVDQFYENYLLHHEDYKRVIGTPERIIPLKKSQTEYLHTLGINFNTREYFEHRLRVGVAHDRVGLTLSLYECAYFKLRTLIYNYIDSLKDQQKATSLRTFVAKIISLDMSLSIESYHRGKALKLKSSLNNILDQQAELQKKADTDYLTHCSTREVILTKLKNELDKFNQDGIKFSVIMIDLDDLGTVNDQHGHLIGDHVMREISTCIQKIVLKTDTIGRYGGDEFLILLPGMKISQAHKFAEQLRATIAGQAINLKSNTIKLTASIGVCSVETHDTLADLIAKVDKALFSAKKNGGNNVVSYSS